MLYTEIGGIHEGKTPNFREGPIFRKSFDGRPSVIPTKPLTPELAFLFFLVKNPEGNCRGGQYHFVMGP
jgi:hypothetical protein